MPWSTASVIPNYDLNNSYSVLHQYPVGVPFFERRAFARYNSEYALHNGGLSFTDIKLFIQNDIPIYYVIKSEDGSYVHSVVICQYRQYPGSAGVVYLMDPNEDDYVSVYMAATSSDLRYVTAYTTYSVCVRRFTEELYYEDI